MNVALTRARYALYVVGHASSLYTNKMWRALIDNAMQREVIQRAERGRYLKAVERIKKKRNGNSSNSGSSGRIPNRTSTKANERQQQGKTSTTAVSRDQQQDQHNPLRIQEQRSGMSGDAVTSSKETEKRHDPAVRQDRGGTSSGSREVKSSRYKGTESRDDEHQRGGRSDRPTPSRNVSAQSKQCTRSTGSSEQRSVDAGKEKRSHLDRRTGYEDQHEKRRNKENRTHIHSKSTVSASAKDGPSHKHDRPKGYESCQRARHGSGSTRSDSSKETDRAKDKDYEKRNKVRDDEKRNKDKEDDKRSKEKMSHEHPRPKALGSLQKARHGSGGTHTERPKQSDIAPRSKERDEKISKEKMSYEHHRPKGLESLQKARHGSGGTHTERSKQADVATGSKERDHEKRSTSHERQRPKDHETHQRARHGSGGMYKSRSDQDKASKCRMTSESSKLHFEKDQQRSSPLVKSKSDQPERLNLSKNAAGLPRNAGSPHDKPKLHNNKETLREAKSISGQSRAASGSKNIASRALSVDEGEMQSASLNLSKGIGGKPRRHTIEGDVSRMAIETISTKSSSFSRGQPTLNTELESSRSISAVERTIITKSLKPVVLSKSAVTPESGMTSSKSVALPSRSTAKSSGASETSSEAIMTSTPEKKGSGPVRPKLVISPEKRSMLTKGLQRLSSSDEDSRCGPASPSRNRAKRGKVWKPGDGPGRQSYVQNTSAGSHRGSDGFSNHERQYQIQSDEQTKSPVLIQDDEEEPPLSQNSHLKQVIERFKSKNSNQKSIKFAEAQPKIRRRRGSNANQPNAHEAGATLNQMEADGDKPNEDANDVNPSEEAAYGDKDKGVFVEQPKRKRRKKTTKPNTSTKSDAPPPEQVPGAEYARNIVASRAGTSKSKIDYNVRETLMNSKRRIAHKRKTDQSEDGAPLSKRSVPELQEVDQSTNQSSYLPTHQSRISVSQSSAVNRPPQRHQKNSLQQGKSRTTPRSTQNPNASGRAPTRLQPPASQVGQRTPHTTQTKVLPARHLSSHDPPGRVRHAPSTVTNASSNQNMQNHSHPRVMGFYQPILQEQQQNNTLPIPPSDSNNSEVNMPSPGQPQSPTPRSILRSPMRRSRNVSVTFSSDTRDNTEESRRKSLMYQNHGWPPKEK